MAPEDMEHSIQVIRTTLMVLYILADVVTVNCCCMEKSCVKSKIITLCSTGQIAHVRNNMRASKYFFFFYLINSFFKELLRQWR